MANRRLLSGGVRSIPCLLVGDLTAATCHYRDQFGFSAIRLLGEPPTAALVSRGESTLLLQVAAATADLAQGMASRRRYADQAWDALLQVDDVELLAKELRGRGTQIQVGIGVTAVSDRTLEVRDDWGNVIAFAESPVSARASLRRAARSAVPNRLRHAVAQRRRDREEITHLHRFQEFCASLERPNPYFMFFTEGLLHWVSQAERHVPRDVNLILIGSALPEQEVTWLREQIGRPLHNIELPVDDNTTWEFLFAANSGDFGYLDIDCFVLEPRLFADMAQFQPDVAVNGIWTYDAAPGKPIACTHFAAINASAARSLRESGAAMSPANYDWTGSNLALLHPRTNCRIPSARQRQLLLRVLPPDERGRPKPPGGSQFFDTLVAYQVAAYAAGFRTHPVRPLSHRTQDSLADQPEGRRIWQQDMSPEVVHVGGVSYYRRYFHQPELRAMYVAAEYAMIRRVVDRLPDRYRRRAERLSAELAHHGLTPDSAVDLLYRHLLADRGLPEQAVARILDLTRHQG